MSIKLKLPLLILAIFLYLLHQGLLADFHYGGRPLVEERIGLMDGGCPAPGDALVNLFVVVVVVPATDSVCASSIAPSGV